MNNSIFTEGIKTRKDGEDYIMSAKIVPFGKISRNRVMYDKESIIATHSKLIGKPVLYNHKADGGLPRGEWTGTEIKQDGMYGTAKIYNTEYNKDLIEYLSHASNPTVSLEVVGDAEKKIDEQSGKQYGLAKVKDWLEASIVNVPGFEEAKILSFEYYIAESLGLGIQSLDSNGGIPVSDFKEIFDRLDKHEALMERMVGYLEKHFESKKVDDIKPEEAKCVEKVDDKKDEVKAEAKADDKKEDKKDEVKAEAKADDKKEDKKDEVKAEAKADDKKEDKKDEVKAEAKADDKKEEIQAEANKEKEDSKEDKKEDKKESEDKAKAEEKKEMVQKEEVRTVDERDNKPDMAKKDDDKDKDKSFEPVKKESVEATDKKEAKDEKESDLPKKPETVKESAKIAKMEESFSNSKWVSNKEMVWNEMLRRHFGN